MFLSRAEFPCESCFLCKVDFKDGRDSATVYVSVSTSSHIVNVETEQPAMKKAKMMEKWDQFMWQKWLFNWIS